MKKKAFIFYFSLEFIYLPSIKCLGPVCVLSSSSSPPSTPASYLGYPGLKYQPYSLHENSRLICTDKPATYGLPSTRCPKLLTNNNRTNNLVCKTIVTYITMIYLSGIVVVVVVVVVAITLVVVVVVVVVVY